MKERDPLAPDDIIKLLGLCLNCTYFVFKGKFYLQIHGAAMGSPVSPIVCNLYMEDFEARALSSAPHLTRWWRRYVDDTHTFLKKEWAQEFTDHLNSIDDDIKWTTEGEVVEEIGSGEEKREERSSAFLDTKAVIVEERKIKYLVVTTHWSIKEE